MSFTIIDRRINGKGKSLGNRQKFLKRIHESIKRSLPDIINSKSLKDIGTDGGVVHIPQKDLNEPSFRHGEGGVRETVRPGNKEFNTGDKFRKPQGSNGGGAKKGSKDGSGEDDFTIEITREEFLDYFFEEMELPDLIKEGLKDVTETKWHNAGFSSTGSPAKLDRSRTLRKSQSRRLTSRSPYKKKLKEAELLRSQIIVSMSWLEEMKPEDQPKYAVLEAELVAIEKVIEGLKRKIENVPFIDPVDLRYHNTVSTEIPITSAVMFCIMDNSGSMGEFEKTLSRKFFVLLYMFLTRKYEKVSLRFIHHTTQAKEVDEEFFFNTRESGGTVVSSALFVLRDIIKKDYANGMTNIYVCQCSDGDNWGDDNSLCYDLLTKDIMPEVQYYAYIEVGQSPGYISDIWDSYAMVGKKHSNFKMKTVHEDNEIYPVFADLFKAKTA
jgi:uncharacterized sporulation protein YeaH/YhbH (DUF444 family)